MKNFKLITASRTTADNLTVLADHYLAETDDEFEDFLSSISNGYDGVEVREMVRFEVGDAPPPMVVAYYAVYKDDGNRWRIYKDDAIGKLDIATKPLAGDLKLFYATEAIL
jgi:hypothetical protein